VNPSARQRRFQRIYDLGCLACRRRGWFAQPCQVHHLNLDEHAGQQRLGDEYTIGLCPWHHQAQPVTGRDAEWTRTYLGPSMAAEPVKFREEFGSDLELLAEQNRLIERAEMNVVGRVAC
jgi:hypothetical protein